MRNAWVIKNYRFALRRTAPTISDAFDVEPFIWVDTENDQAYVCLDNTAGSAIWLPKAPDSIITTSANSIFFIENTTITDESDLLITEDSAYCITEDGYLIAMQ